MDRVMNLDISGFRGTLESMGRRVFGSGWTPDVRSNVLSRYNIDALSSALPAMSQHSPLTHLDFAGTGSKAFVTADFEELTFDRVVEPLSSPSYEFTAGKATAVSTAKQHSSQGVLGRRDDNLGRPVSEMSHGRTQTTYGDGDRMRRQERVAVTAKFDQPMAVFSGWVRLDAWMTSSNKTVHESGLFFVDIAIPLSELRAPQIHEHVLPPTFTRSHPGGFVERPRLKVAPDPVDKAPLPRNPFAPRAFGSENGPGWFEKVLGLRLSPPGLVRPVSAGGDQASSSRTPLLSRPQNSYGTFAPVFRPAASHILQLRGEWKDPEPPKNPPQPPERASLPSWHPSDMLAGLDPQSGLLEAMREDLAPALGSDLDAAIADLSQHYGPEVLAARLTHESGTEWTHGVPVGDGTLTVKVRPVREPGADFVSRAPTFEADFVTESQSSATHTYANQTDEVRGVRDQFKIPPISLTGQVLTTQSVKPGAPGLRSSVPRVGDPRGAAIAGGGEIRAPERVKTTEPHNLFRQPIRFDITYEYSGTDRPALPRAPEPVRLAGVFAYSEDDPTVTVDASAGAVTTRPQLSATQVVAKVWPHRSSDPSADDEPESSVQQRPVPRGGAVGDHILDSMAAEGIAVFGDDWPAVRAELADYIATMDVHRALGRFSRGRTTTINLKSVEGGKVVVGMNIDSLARASSPASSEFYYGGVDIHNAGVSSGSRQSGQGYAQGQVEKSLADIPFIPAAVTNYLSELLGDHVADAAALLFGRTDIGGGSERRNTRANNTTSGRYLRLKGKQLTQVGTATVHADMSRPRGQSGERIRGVGEARVNVIVRETQTGTQAHERRVPRAGIVQRSHDRSPSGYGDDGLPLRGLSDDSIVGTIMGESFRRRTLNALNDDPTSAIYQHVARVLSGAQPHLRHMQLRQHLPAMTRGEQVELLRLGSLRITGTARVRHLGRALTEYSGAWVNVLNEVNRIQTTQTSTTFDLGWRTLLGLQVKSAAFKGVVLAGGGIGRRWRSGASHSEAAKVAAHGKFKLGYVTFDATFDIELTVHDGDYSQVLPEVDIHAPLLIPESETRVVDSDDAHTGLITQTEVPAPPAGDQSVSQGPTSKHGTVIQHPEPSSVPDRRSETTKTNAVPVPPAGDGTSADHAETGGAHLAANEDSETSAQETAISPVAEPDPVTEPPTDVKSVGVDRATDTTAPTQRDISGDDAPVAGPSRMRVTAPAGERLGVLGNGWCLLYSVVIGTPPEQWPAEWVGSMDAHSAHAAMVAEARAGRLWGGEPVGVGRRALDHAVEALQARVIWSLMAGGRDGVPSDVAATVRGTQDVRQLDRWLARASEAQLRARLTELGLADDHVIEDENWLPAGALQRRYIDERVRQLTTEGDTSAQPPIPPGMRRADAVARALTEVDFGAQRRANNNSLSLRSQFEYLRDRRVVPTVGQLRPAELSAAVSESSAHRFTEQEYSELLAAVEDWSGEGWRGRYGDTFAVLIAHALQVQVQVHRRDGQSSAVGPEGARNISVYYNGRNHYEASLPPASD